jgi:hypothetical protein
MEHIPHQSQSSEAEANQTAISLARQWEYAKSFDDLNVEETIHTNSGRYMLVDLKSEVGGLTGHDENGLALAMMLKVGDKSYALWHYDKDRHQTGADYMLITDEAYDADNPKDGSYMWLDTTQRIDFALPGERDGKPTAGVELSISKTELGYRLAEGAPTSKALHRKNDDVFRREHEERERARIQAEQKAAWDAGEPERIAAAQKLEAERAERAEKRAQKVYGTEREYSSLMSQKNRERAREESTLLVGSLLKTELGQVITKACDIADKSWQEIVDTVRTNSDLRVTIGKFLIEYMNRPGHYHMLADNVYTNRDLKGPNHGANVYGFEKFTDREYTALLVLAMLDGTYDSSREKADIIDSHRSGNGQHRRSAKGILEELRRDARESEPVDNSWMRRSEKPTS